MDEVVNSVEEPKKLELDLSPQLSTDQASYLKLVLGKSVIAVENFSQIIPPLVQVLDGLITKRLVVIKAPPAP